MLPAQAQVERETLRYFVVVLNEAVAILVSPVAPEIPNPHVRLVFIAASGSIYVWLPQQKIRPG